MGGKKQANSESNTIHLTSTLQDCPASKTKSQVPKIDNEVEPKNYN